MSGISSVNLFSSTKSHHSSHHIEYFNLAATVKPHCVLYEYFPVPKTKNACLLVGPFSKIEEPDLVLIFFCSPKQADILARIHAYLGELFEGFSGSGGCLFNIRSAFQKRVPHIFNRRHVVTALYRS